MPRDIKDWIKYFQQLAVENSPGTRNTEVKNTPGYQAEKLAPRGARELAEPYATFRKMRRLAPNPAYINGFNYGYSAASPEIFVKQAEFMSDFEDDCEDVAEFYSAYPTFQQMNDAQLRTYFTWRTQLRRGHIDPIGAPYALCYCYELINNVGDATPAENLTKLIALWTAFRAKDERLDPQFRRWALDYCLANELAEQFADFNARLPLPYADVTGDVERMLSDEYLDDLVLLEGSSSYKLTNGQFFKKGDLTQLYRCALSAIRAVDELFAKEQLDFRRLFIEKRVEPNNSLFQGAIFVPVRGAKRREIQLGKYENIVVTGNVYRREFYSFEVYKPVVGFIFKTLDARMRDAFGFAKPLKLPETTQMKNAFLRSEFADALVRLQPWKKQAYGLLKRKAFIETLDGAIAAFLRGENEIAARRVDIDFTQLDRIRAEHEATAEKLNIDEEQTLGAESDEEQLPVGSADTPLGKGAGAPVDTGIANFSESERNLLSALLRGETPVGLDAELLIESINEKSLDAIGDNIIDTSGETPVIYEEYKNLI
ncbi:MAG: TerB N-terminal domain-containing protein [Oscillospiraceae bacterium]|jgi:hypothetical protein|nr:TerB N-terminal domain-containing protein [Oscillospiraceae bacterium]